jgi:hypothetical protein
MSPRRAVKIQRYRDCRLEIRDGGGQGWTIHIHTPRGGKPGTIRNRMPRGLAMLLEEARARVDRECGDGSAPRW